ncbi:MAG: DUF4091 domain-containing protein [Saccharofermentanales bacterium]
MAQYDFLDVRPVSSLAKIFPDEELHEPVFEQGSFLMNEPFSFQIAYRWSGSVTKGVQVCIDSSLSSIISLYTVGLVPSELPCYADHDANVLRAVPGLYPDPLYEISEEGLPLLPGQWRSVWVEIVPDSDLPSGEYPMGIRFLDSGGSCLGDSAVILQVIGARLPQQRLIHTDWFHADCIASLYHDGIFSEAHWRRVGQFITTAVRHGINMLLTPVFTPPLDTMPGGERPTVQLVDVERSGNDYRFHFDKLKRWFDLALSCGITYFEISHLFTQWGAEHAPKIMGKADGKDIRLFGWDTEAAGDEYRRFLSVFIPSLTDFIRQQGLESACWFHVSDEPSMANLGSYSEAAGILSGCLKGFPVIDALSDFAFYEKGIVRKPVPATDHIEPFIENKVPGLWTYYCCGQYKSVSNRFFDMPSARNRIIGMQLYKYDIEGFLHWGYNFWYSQHSLRAIDPFRITDADYAFPSGDAFVVYPGADGPIVSLRLKVFADGLSDLRALQLLESYIGRDETIRILEEDMDQPLTFSCYPSSAGWLLRKRETVNRMIGSLARTVAAASGPTSTASSPLQI